MNTEKIVFVIGNYMNGGVARRSVNIANSLAKKGYNCIILVTGAVAPEVYLSVDDRVEVVVLKEFCISNKNSTEIVKKTKQISSRIRNLKRVRYLTRRFDDVDNLLAFKIREYRRCIDLSNFIALNTNAIYIAFGLEYYIKLYFASQFFKIKIIYAERNAPEIEYPNDLKEKTRLLNCVKKADKIVVQTNGEAEFYNDSFNNLVVINNPLKPNLPNRYDGERKPIIVNFCRIAKQKNLLLLINSFIKFHKKYSEYTLEIYGNVVSEEEELLKNELITYIKDICASKYIKILPPRADIHNQIIDYSMYVSSSDFEGLSNSTIEALAIGLPCICTDCLGGGTREVIINEVNGLITPICDEDALYNAMCRFAEDIELRDKCSINALRIRDRLSIDNICGEWINVIEGIK